MFVFKKYVIENQIDLIARIGLDTEEWGYLADIERFFHGEVLRKPWIGKVNTTKNTFSVMRVKRGFFSRRASFTQIVGCKTVDNKIELRFQPALHALLGVLGTVVLGLFIANFSDILL